MEPVAIALGSNLGDRDAHLQSAVRALREQIPDLLVSEFIESDAVGVAAQPPFLNGAAAGRWRGTAEHLLDLLLAIEDRHGRERPWPGAPRTLDLDLILFGGLVVTGARLTVPHPRFRERPFVLNPLSRIAPGMKDPVTGLTVRELCDGLKKRTSCE